MGSNDSIKLKSYLSFGLEGDEFAIPAFRIQNIIELRRIVPIPESPSHVKGAINLKGAVVPIIDLRLMLGMLPIIYNGSTCIVVLAVETPDGVNQIGVLVDEVRAILEVFESQIQPAKGTDTLFAGNYIDSGISIENRYVLVLNIDLALRSNTLPMLMAGKSSTARSAIIKDIG